MGRAAAMAVRVADPAPVAGVRAAIRPDVSRAGRTGPADRMPAAGTARRPSVAETVRAAPVGVVGPRAGSAPGPGVGVQARPAGTGRAGAAARRPDRRPARPAAARRLPDRRRHDRRPQDQQDREQSARGGRCPRGHVHPRCGRQVSQWPGPAVGPATCRRRSSSRLLHRDRAFAPDTPAHVLGGRGSITVPGGVQRPGLPGCARGRTRLSAAATAGWLSSGWRC